MKTKIREIFSEVCGTYELANHVLTFGLDLIWRRTASKEAVKAGGTLWLDVCSGTGEFARNLDARARGQAKVVMVDFCPAMLERARPKGAPKKLLAAIADASDLPFPDNVFDLATISFATRNLNHSRGALKRSFREVYRVLKPGAYFVNLETSQPRSQFIRKLFNGYVRTVIKPVGYLLSGSKSGYAYLSSSIPRFYSPEELAGILVEAGFDRVGWKPFSFGIVAIHVGVKKA